jgi:hypothetical protein
VPELARANGVGESPRTRNWDNGDETGTSMQLRMTTAAEAMLPGCVRLVGEITYDAAGMSPDQLWFEVPADLAGLPAQSGNAWLLALLPLAVQLEEPLRLPSPVDPQLLRGAEEIMRVWSRWVPGWRPVPIEAPLAAPHSDPDLAGRTGLFFTAGVDSFFTAYHYDEAAAARPALGRQRVDDLIYVWGYDIRLDRPEAFARKRQKLGDLATALGKRLIVIASNYRDTRLGSVDWALISHGPALGAAGLLLESRHRSILISGSAAYDCTKPLGSHPFIDSRMSTTRTAFTDYGNGFSRSDKVAWLAGRDLALRNLQVCWRSGNESNCGRCEKCYRTQLILEICGVREQATSFPPGVFRLEHVRFLRTPSPAGAYILESMIPLARAQVRPDLIRLIRAALARERRLQAAERVLNGIPRLPVLRNAIDKVKRVINRRNIT